MTEQRSLFTIPSVEIKAPIHDPYWDEIDRVTVDTNKQTNKRLCDDLDGLISPSQLPKSAPEQNTPKSVALGDWVKISLEWLSKCRNTVDKQFHKYYQHKSSQDLVCKVIGLHDSGGVYIPRGPQRFFYVPEKYFEIAHQHKTAWRESEILVGEQVNNSTPTLSVDSLVGEQVESDTKKTAHQHDTPTHWVEKYWVQRGGNKYWYYRYAWMNGRKINRVYIGSTQSAIAKNRNLEVESAIADGESPAGIQNLIHSWRKS